MDCIETENTDKPLALTVNSSDVEKTENVECKGALEGPALEALPAISIAETAAEPGEAVDIKVIYNKTKYDVSTTLNTTVAELKKELQGLLGVPEKNQKLMFKGLLRDDQTVGNAGVTKGSKLMVVGSKPNDIIAVTSVSKQDIQEAEKPTSSKEPFCKQKVHRKILDKGVPDDAMPGIRNTKPTGAVTHKKGAGRPTVHTEVNEVRQRMEQELKKYLKYLSQELELSYGKCRMIVKDLKMHPYQTPKTSCALPVEALPPAPLCGMLNKHGGKLRLTFKLEQDQLWLGTKERTEKLAMSSIKSIVSESIEGHEQYHIMGIQLGPTEASRYWIYWVPAQYVDAIKDAILGKWQYF